MKSVKKFETFPELKSHEKSVLDYSMKVEKHKAFEEFIKSVKAQRKNNRQSK